MSRYSDAQRCFYSGGFCSFPDDDEDCECCSKYANINCRKCGLSNGWVCSRDGHEIKALGHVCAYLQPNCDLCGNLTRKYNGYEFDYSCKLGKELSHQGCSDGLFVPSEAYRKWRKDNPEPKE